METTHIYPPRRAGGDWRDRALAAAALLLAGLSGSPAVAAPGGSAGEAPSKSQYHLFRPVPRDQLRELSADRPDTTESPITVDPGHFQAELNFFDVGRTAEGARRTDTWNALNLNLKLGLLAHVDLHLGFAAYTVEQTREAGVTTTTHGFGDLALRLKINFWGNDRGRTALAIIPWVSIPSHTSSSTGHPEVGLVTVFSGSIIERLSVGTQLHVFAQWDADRDRYSLGIEHTLCFGLNLHGPLGVFLEYVGVGNSSPVDNPYQGSLKGGVTVRLGKHVMLDAAAEVGLTEAADDWKVLTGMTFRI